MKGLRVGVVGCGEVTQIVHLPSLLQLADKFTVTAVCDISPSVLQRVADQWNVSGRFADYHDLVTQADVDVVLVANPDAHHAEVVLAAMAARKHVLVEKPMCITFREADAIIAAQKQAGVIVQVGQMRRYAPAFVEACRRVQQIQNITLARVHDVLGHNPLFIEPTSRVFRATDIPQDKIDASKALRDKLLVEAIGEAPADLKTAYSILLGLSTHDLGAMRELLGIPKRVLYAAQRQGGLYLSAAFDYGSYVCNFETGIDSIPRFEACLEVYSNDQVVRVDYDTPYVRNLPIRLTVTCANGRGVREQMDHPIWGDAFVAEWEAFYDDVQNQRTPKTSPEDFRKDLELFRDMVALMR
jgi:predicted dehydrogenase